MRSYNVAVASLALDVPPKWVDNAISQHSVEGVVSAQRGVARRISFAALFTLAIAQVLQSDLSMPMADALSVGRALVHDTSAGEVVRGRVSLKLDLPALRRTLETRLADAMESAPAPPRGRPSSTR